MSGLENTRARSARKSLKGPMVVQSYTIGTNLIYPLLSENVSKSGLLLIWESDYAAPFQENTIIEMTIDTLGAYLDRPLTCLGKIVRKTAESKTCYRFGIRIVQIDPKDQHVWEGMIGELDIEAGLEASPSYDQAS